MLSQRANAPQSSAILTFNWICDLREKLESWSSSSMMLPESFPSEKEFLHGLDLKLEFDQLKIRQKQSWSDLGISEENILKGE